MIQNASHGALVRLPGPTDLDILDDPAAKLVALVEPSCAWLAQAVDVTAVDDVRAKASALETYARARSLADVAVGAAQTIALRAAARMGDLLPVEVGGRGKASQAGDALRRDDRSRFRTLAANRPDVEAAIVELAPKGELSRNAVLSRIRAKRQERDAAERSAGEAPDLAALERYGVIYCDPPWRYEHAKTNSRRVENHYPTMTHAELCALPVPAADDSVLVMWMTPPKVAEALALIDAWGFTYRTGMVWVKDSIGMGYYARQRHELIAIATRGTPGVPAPSRRPDSVLTGARGEHSAKPVLHALLDDMWPGVPKIELFARVHIDRPWWSTWGNDEAVAP